MEIINALGRRKTAVARVYLSKGKGNISINKKAMAVMFPIDVLQAKINTGARNWKKPLVAYHLTKLN